MNASRRICCNAANAFRPAPALNNVFFGRSARRWISSTTGSDATPSSLEVERASQHSVSFGDSRQQNKKPLAEGNTKTEESRAGVPDDGTGDTLERGKAGLKQDKGDQISASLASDSPSTRRIDSVSITEFSSRKLHEIARKKVETAGAEAIEYEGQYVKPVNKESIEPSSQPWVQALDHKTTQSTLVELGAEAKAFANWIRPTTAEAAAREAVIQQTSDTIRRFVKDYDVEVFGSSRNGLGLASSDVDLRIYHKKTAQRIASNKSLESLPPDWRRRQMNMEVLDKLQRFFKHNPDYLFCNIRHARYPLLHVLHKPSGYDVQIVCSNDTAKQRTRIAKYLEEYPHILDVYAVVKTALDIRGLTDVYRGGLGSYGLLNMIIAANNLSMTRSKTREDQPSEEVVATAELKQRGHLLEQFLDFYGKKLNTYKSAVSVDPFGVTTKINPESLRDTDLTTLSDSYLRIRDNSLPYLLCLEDPEDPTNDLGCKAYGWKHIRETLHTLHKGLHAQSAHGERIKTGSLLHPFVGSAYPTYMARRTLAERYGSNARKSPENIKRETAKAIGVMLRAVGAARAREIAAGMSKGLEEPTKYPSVCKRIRLTKRATSRATRLVTAVAGDDSMVVDRPPKLETLNSKE